MDRPAGLATAQAARLLLGGYFFVPYLVLYASTVDISLSLLLVVEGFFALLVVLFDRPARRLASALGPRRALIVGAVLRGGAAAALGLAPSAGVFWAVQPLFAAATTLTVGADTALTAGLSRGRDVEASFQPVRLVATVLVLTSASALSLVGMRWTFLATALAQLVAAVLLVLVPDVRLSSDVDSVPLGTRLRGLASGFPLILASTAFSVLLFLVPVFYVRAGLGEGLVGIAAAGVALAAIALPEHWSPRVSVVLAVVAAVALGTPWAAVVLAAAVVAQAAQAQLLPRFSARVLDDLWQHGEARAMAIVTTGRNAGFAVLAPLAGVLTTWTGPGGVAVLCGVLLVVAGGPMLAPRATEVPGGRDPRTRVHQP